MLYGATTIPCQPNQYIQIFPAKHKYAEAGALFINTGDIYCFGTGLPISMSKGMYINITILRKTVNLHCKYLK